MNLLNQNTSRWTKEFNLNFWLNTPCKNEIVSLLHNAIHKKSENAPLEQWIENTIDQVNHLEQLLYNSYHLCPTLYQSVINKISGYDNAIIELNKRLTKNNTTEVKKVYLKQLLTLQQKTQVVLLYINV